MLTDRKGGVTFENIHNCDGDGFKVARIVLPKHTANTNFTVANTESSNDVAGQKSEYLWHISLAHANTSVMKEMTPKWST